MISMLSNDGEISYGIREWLADSVLDLGTIPLKGAAPGSRALVTEDMTVYLLSNDKTWLPYSASSGEGGSSSPSSGVSQEYVDEQIKAIVGLAPETLNSLEELAQAFGNDPEALAKMSQALTDLQAEVTTTKNDISGIQTKIELMASSDKMLSTAIGKVNDDLEAEIAERQQKDDFLAQSTEMLSVAVSKVNENLTKESEERVMAYNELDSRLSNLEFITVNKITVATQEQFLDALNNTDIAIIEFGDAPVALELVDTDFTEIEASINRNVRITTAQRYKAPCLKLHISPDCIPTLDGEFRDIVLAGEGTVIFDNATVIGEKDGEHVVWDVLAGSSGIRLEETANIEIVINGSLTAIGGTFADGIKVPCGATLTITGNSLVAIGNRGIETWYYDRCPEYSFGDPSGDTQAYGCGIGDMAHETGNIIIKNLKSCRAEGYGKSGYGIGGGSGHVLDIINSTIDYVRGGLPIQNFAANDKYGVYAPEGGAAIGFGMGANTDGTINIINSVINKAIGGSKSAAIGTGFWGSITVNIENSVINNAVGGSSAAAIGGSRVGYASQQIAVVNIKGSTINAFGGQCGAGIGGGYDSDCAYPTSQVYINIDDNSIINAVSGKTAAAIGTGYHAGELYGSIGTTCLTNTKTISPFYKSSYTTAQNIGFGVIDPNREGKGYAQPLGKEIEFTVDGEPIENPFKKLNYLPYVTNMGDYIDITDTNEVIVLSGNYYVANPDNHKVTISHTSANYHIIDMTPAKEGTAYDSALGVGLWEVYLEADVAIADPDEKMFLLNIEIVDGDQTKVFTKECYISTTVPVYTAEDFQTAIDQNWVHNVVSLQSDLTVDNSTKAAAFTINQPGIIDGNNYTLSVNNKKAFEVYSDVTIRNMTIKNTNILGRCVDTRTAGDGITVTLENVTLEAVGSNNTQPLTIGGTNMEGINIILRDCTINAGESGYGIINFVKANIILENCTINGYCAIYFKSGSWDSMLKTVGNNTLSSYNKHTDPSSSFATIVYEEHALYTELSEGTVLEASAVEGASQELIGYSWTMKNGYTPQIIVGPTNAALLKEEGHNIVKLTDTRYKVERR